MLNKWPSDSLKEAPNHLGKRFKLRFCSPQLTAVILLAGCASLFVLPSFKDMGQTPGASQLYNGTLQRAAIHIDWEGFHWGESKGFIGENYVNRRMNMSYYTTVFNLVHHYGADAKSIIDVGAPWPFVTAFTWIPHKTMLNYDYPVGYKPPNLVDEIIQIDFFKFTAKQTYDVVICNQVLEHIQDPAAFAKKLLEIGKVVVVTVPHYWPSGPQGHVQHRITWETLIEWFGGVEYAEMGIVREALAEGSKDNGMKERLYAVFDQRDK